MPLSCLKLSPTLTWVLRPPTPARSASLTVPDTSCYDIDQTKCLDIPAAFPGNLNEGDYVMPFVHAILGATNPVDTVVIYSATAGTVTYQCRGATLTYSCKLL